MWRRDFAHPALFTFSNSRPDQMRETEGITMGLEMEIGMSLDENKAFVRRYLKAISGRPKTDSLVSEYVSDPELRRFIGAFEAGFPKYELQVEDMIAEGDKVVVRAAFRGTHQGEIRGVLATGKVVTFPVIIIYQLERGKIVRHWLASDTLSMAHQIGVVADSVS
jgi:predicted ester cyclase